MPVEEMYESTTAESILLSWEQSLDPMNGDWITIPIGISYNEKDVRKRYLRFSSNADGTNMMMFGSTGSGKSEALISLVTNIALNYSPEIVNFILIDYKGGMGFSDVSLLPHVIHTAEIKRENTKKLFLWINQELNRRMRALADANVRDIKQLHKTVSKNHKSFFPFIFIIIDEFAEMFYDNIELRAQVDSITRLGRALGVQIIMAAQRPTTITDQMRANIKARVVFRVETINESLEVIRNPDAAYLPPSIPGRAILQIGAHQEELIQFSLVRNLDQMVILTKEVSNKINFSRKIIKLSSE